MARLDLRGHEEGPPIDPAVLPKLSPKEHTLAVKTWRGRMLNEHVSAQVFSGLIPQLMRAEVDVGYPVAVAKMIDDELRHARQCALAVTALGGEAVGELPPIHDLPAHADVEPLEALLRNVLSVCCLSETVAVSLIEAERRQLEGSPLSDLLRLILADEVQHARLGWKLFEEYAPTFDAARRERLGAYLETAFAHLIEHELAHLSPLPAPSAACAAAGVCDGALARSIFFDAMQTIIVPRLEQHGLPAARAYAAAEKLRACA